MKKPAKAPPSKAKAAAPVEKRPVHAAAVAEPRTRAEAASAGPATEKEQAQKFEKAMAQFRKQEFRAARALLEEARRGPSAEVAHAAEMYVRMCDRRMAGGEVKLQTPEDHYNYAITLMNQRRMESAEDHLRKAVNGNARAGHYHYALALCCGLRGNLAEAAAHLKRAIEIEPGNRVAALNDIEFQPIASKAPVREVLLAGRSDPG